MDNKQIATVGKLVLEQMIAGDKAYWGSKYADEKIYGLDSQIRIISLNNFCYKSEAFRKLLIKIAATSLLIISENKREFLLWNKMLDKMYNKIEQLSENNSFYAPDIKILSNAWIKDPFSDFQIKRTTSGLDEDILLSIAAHSIILYSLSDIVSIVNQEVLNEKR